MSSELPSFKKFVSEDEIEEQKKKRQEEWEKVRTPDQPLEAPEEKFDPRSLYDQLKEQKDKKQQEYEEQFQLKNQVKGLESDEAEFLDFVNNKQEEIRKAREEENEETLNEYRNAMVNQTVDNTKESSMKFAKPSSASSGVPSTSRRSQLSLLAGAVKRKGTVEDSTNELKKCKSEPSPGSSHESSAASFDDIPAEGSKAQIASKPQVIAILPGLGNYSGTSSESDSSSEDSDPDTDMFSKKAVHCNHS